MKQYVEVKQIHEQCDDFGRVISRNGWISTSERNPTDNGKYLVTMKTGTVTILAYNSTWITWGEKQNVIAWMPLPLAYRV